MPQNSVTLRNVHQWLTQTVPLMLHYHLLSSTGVSNSRSPFSKWQSSYMTPKARIVEDQAASSPRTFGGLGGGGGSFDFGLGGRGGPSSRLLCGTGGGL